MKNYKDSDYAVNKYSSGIVYRFANEVIEITLDDYLKENPEKTEWDFLQLKAISDEIYYEQVRDENAQTKKNVSIHNLEETDKLSTEPLEAVYMEEEENRLLEQAIDTYLTEKQARRIRLCIYYGLSCRKIARIEGIHFRSVYDSLVLAKKKLEKYFKNF